MPDKSPVTGEIAFVPSFWMTGVSLFWLLFVAIIAKSEELSLLLSLPVTLIGGLFPRGQLLLSNILPDELSFVVACVLLLTLLLFVGRYSVRMNEPILIRSIGTVIMLCVFSLCSWMCFSFDLTFLNPTSSDSQLIFKISEFLVIGQFFSVVFCISVDAFRTRNWTTKY